MTQESGALSLAIVNTHFEQQSLGGGRIQAEDSFWFAVQTKPRHEKKVNLELREKGIHSFLPLHLEKRQWSDRQQWIESPLFSQYVFVRVPITNESRTRVLQTRGILQFVGTPGRGTPIPDEQIENVQAITEHRIPMTPHEFLRVGTRVRIRGGALNGIEGVLAAIKNDKSLVVSVDLIQKSVAIRIDGFEVEPA